MWILCDNLWTAIGAMTSLFYFTGRMRELNSLILFSLLFYHCEHTLLAHAAGEQRWCLCLSMLPSEKEMNFYSSLSTLLSYVMAFRNTKSISEVRNM